MASGVERLHGKVAIVTGGVKGIGRACADIFVENGAKVAVFDIAEATSDKEKLWFLKCDMKNEDDIKKSIEDVIERWGHIDCLVNNAGWHPPAKEIDDFTSTEFRDLFELNLMGYFLSCKYALPYLRTTKGNIVNISSLAKSGQAKAVTYTATKGGISAMTKTLAVDEAKHGVRVNEVSPGSIWTPLMEEWARSLKEDCLEEQLNAVKSLNLMNTFGQPREIAQAVLYLATDATYCTGADLNVTAGIEVGFGTKVF